MMPAAAEQNGPAEELFWTTRSTLDAIRTTLDKLDAALAVVDKRSRLGRGFLRRPVKHAKLSLKAGDITAYRERIKSYNIVLTSILQMVNL